jgi:hypothetical protein
VSVAGSRCLIGVALVGALALFPPAARASEGDAPPEDRARTLATDLFDRGNALMDRGRCEVVPIGDADACAQAADAFLRAWELYPDGLGALRNLAYVEKALRRVASAARHFRELARRAPLDPRPARQLWADFARKELEELEPRVPHLMLRIALAPPRATATLDGTDLPRGSWGAPLDLDPGMHAVRFQGPELLPFEQIVPLAEGESRTLDVTLVPREDATTRLPSQRTMALVTTGVGAAVVVVGLGFGVAAIVDRHDACGATGCDPVAYEHGRSLARTSNIVTGIGAAVAVGGVTWFLLAPKESPAARATVVAPWASLDGAGLVVTRRF